MNYAKEAYEAYCRHTGWKSLATGATLPQWADLPESIRTAWMVSIGWVAGLWEASGCHESRLHTRIRELESQLTSTAPQVVRVIESSP